MCSLFLSIFHKLLFVFNEIMKHIDNIKMKFAGCMHFNNVHVSSLCPQQKYLLGQLCVLQDVDELELPEQELPPC